MEAKATLEFNLPEQEHDFKYAIAGVDALLALNDLDQDMRSAIRHEWGALAKFTDDEGNIRKSCIETLEKVRARLWEIHREYKLPDLV